MNRRRSSRRSSFRLGLLCVPCALALGVAPAAQVGTVDAEQKISETAGGFGGVLDPSDLFGYSVSSLGDLDGDGNEDLAVGAYQDDDGGGDQGAVWILFLNADGTVASEQKISETTGGFGGVLDPGDNFGISVAALGDLDGDGNGDLAVGAWEDDDGGSGQGAAWILFLNSDGTVASEQKISETTGGFGGVLDPSDHFGSSVSSLGDLDGDGNEDLAVGAYGDDDGGNSQGAVWVLFLNADGTVASEQKISETTGGFGGVLDVTDFFGVSVSSLGDLDADGNEDLAVGAQGDDDGGSNQGAVWILFLNANGTVASEQEISETAGGFGGVLDGNDFFGASVSSLSDLDGDGTRDLAVGALFDDDGGTDQGAVWILFLEGPDTTPPVITCPGDVTAECMSPSGAIVGFSVTATDDTDPSPVVSCVPPSGSLFAHGTTTVNCTATDASGNSAMCSFDVTVEDTTPPVPSCPSDITVECTNPGGEVVSYSPTASDLCDPAPSVVSVPPSGSTFTLGTTTVTVTATDAMGNSAMCTFDVTIEDTTPPVPTCPGDITIECTGPGGEVVTYSGSASDACDPAPSLVFAPPSGSTFTLGTTTVTATATDASGNSAQCTFDVTVEDTTAPTLSCPSGVTVIDGKSGPPGEIVFFSVTAGDLCDPAPSVTCVPPSGSVFPRGTTLVTCTATDGSGNQTVCLFPVVVLPPFRQASRP